MVNIKFEGATSSNEPMNETLTYTFKSLNHLIMKNVKNLFVLCIIFLFTGITTLFAHPGHGATEGNSLIHYLSEPLHATILASVILIIATSATWMIIRKKTKVQVDL